MAGPSSNAQKRTIIIQNELNKGLKLAFDRCHKDTRILQPIKSDKSYADQLAKKFIFALTDDQTDYLLKGLVNKFQSPIQNHNHGLLDYYEMNIFRQNQLQGNLFRTYFNDSKALSKQVRKNLLFDLKKTLIE